MPQGLIIAKGYFFLLISVSPIATSITRHIKNSTKLTSTGSLSSKSYPKATSTCTINTWIISLMKKLKSNFNLIQSPREKNQKAKNVGLNRKPFQLTVKQSRQRTSLWRWSRIQTCRISIVSVWCTKGRWYWRGRFQIVT